MTEPDLALETLKTIIEEFSSFVTAKGAVSEADTRVKLIDRILVQVCGWPEDALTREEHVESGFVDYILTIQTRKYVSVEAKRENVAFTFSRDFLKDTQAFRSLTHRQVDQRSGKSGPRLL